MSSFFCIPNEITKRYEFTPVLRVKLVGRSRVYKDTRVEPAPAEHDDRLNMRIPTQDVLCNTKFKSKQ